MTARASDGNSRSHSLEHLDDDSLAMTALRLKLLARHSKKNILISAGTLQDKERVLGAVKALDRSKFAILATHGTSAYFTQHGVENRKLFKIADDREPNISSFIAAERVDLIINILTGDHDYDEASDNSLIRRLAVQYGIPIFTDVGVAIDMLRQISRMASGAQDFRQDGAEPWNLRTTFLESIAERGGFASYHAHFDKAYLISDENLKLGMVDMQKKWALYDYLKENYTHDDLVERISRCVQKMIDQGVTHCRTLVDADSTVKLLPIRAAIEVRERFRGRITFEIGTQPLKGVLEPESRKYFVKACELADVIGGLPSKDRPTPEKHIDFILSLGRDMRKPVDVHVDQENNPMESETEMLVDKTVEHGMQGQVCAIHAISVSARAHIEQERIVSKLKDADVGVIVCPSAAISMKQLETTAPLHNSIAPVPMLLAKGVRTYLGIDNISDLFMPLVDGDMWFECRLLMEACRHYDIDAIARLASDKSGFSRGTESRVVAVAS